MKQISILFLFFFIYNFSFCQIEKKKISIKKITTSLKIDGNLLEPEWKTAAIADKFTELKPTPFKAESVDNATQIYFLYNNEGIYIGGYLHEKTKDSISSELVGRDGFGNNDFLGVVFDTYEDKLNGFEYFVTPLGEQFDAKISPNINGNNEDFEWNAVWKSAAKINADGWSFEMFIPYSAIRFSNKKIQDWGLNIVRQNQKRGNQLFWQAINPTANGYLTQAGFLTGFENIKPPLRLQFSPYIAAYHTHDGTLTSNEQKTKNTISGGMDIKYGINQAFTLDMTLIPDFGQVQSDQNVLNLTPFETKFSDNRPFFTEGADLFNKGNLYYSRSIGGLPYHYDDVALKNNEIITQNPTSSSLYNATKISGRTQNGLGIGFLNAITKPQYAIAFDTISLQYRKVLTNPLTNYNVFVLNQSLKNNSSVSIINTNVWRAGNDKDANVTAALFDFNDKKNKWNIGGNISYSNIMEAGKTKTGYAHSIYIGKTSGRFNFNIWQDLNNKDYDKTDFAGYFSSNNNMDQGIWAAYSWNKPKAWYNWLRLNTNIWYSRLVSSIDLLNRKEMMYQNAGFSINFNAQTKKLRFVGFNLNGNPNRNDFYESRTYGRVFKNKSRIAFRTWFETNQSKKVSGNINLGAYTGGIFKAFGVEYTFSGKVRFNSKLSINASIDNNTSSNQVGYAGTDALNNIFFARRNNKIVETNIDFKYSFNTKMAITLATRHYFGKVNPTQFYLLNNYGNLETLNTAPNTDIVYNANKNFNDLTVDLLYNWQFAQGSFLTLAWKDIGGNFSHEFERNYYVNLNKTISGSQYNSLSVKVIYFIDYVTAKQKWSKKK